MFAVLVAQVGKVRVRRLAVGLSLFVAATFLVLATGLSPAASAASGTADLGVVTHAGGGTVTIARGDSASSVFAVGGRVVVAGTVRNVLVGVETHVILQSSAVVGASHTAGDTSLVLIGGSLTRQTGALVHGKTSTVTGSQVSSAWQSAVAAPFSHFFGVLSLIIWAALTILFVLLAVVLAALAPRQLAAVGRRVTARPWPTFGWGLLIAVVIVPIVSVLLVVSIIGLLAVVPWGIVVLVIYAMGVVAIAALLGEAITRRLGGRVGLVLAALIGVVVLRLVELIPFVGSVVSGVVTILAFGAAAMAFWDWRRGRGGAAPAQVVGEEPTAPETEQRAA